RLAGGVGAVADHAGGGAGGVPTRPAAARAELHPPQSPRLIPRSSARLAAGAAARRALRPGPPPPCVCPSAPLPGPRLLASHPAAPLLRHQWATHRRVRSSARPRVPHTPVGTTGPSPRWPTLRRRFDGTNGCPSPASAGRRPAAGGRDPGLLAGGAAGTPTG